MVIATHSPALLKWRQGTVSRAGEDEEQLEHILLVAIKDNAAFLENNWAVSYQLNHAFATWATIPLMGIYAEK